MRVVNSPMSVTVPPVCARPPGYAARLDSPGAWEAKARARSVELGVSDRVKFVHADASDFVAPQPVDIAACLGATWIGGGVTGTIDLLQKSLKPEGIMLIGHPFWRAAPPSQEAVEACGADEETDWLSLDGLIDQMLSHGYDVIEMTLTDPDSWDRYVAAQWRNLREFIDKNPDDPLTPGFREELRTAPILHAKYQREYLGWGVFALKRR